MLLASAVLAGSLLVTGAQARGGGGGGGHMGGGFGGGHVGSFGGGVGAGLMAHANHEHFGVGGRRIVGSEIDGDGLACPYDTSYTPPYTCTY
jgi:hypothetical protein